MSLGSFGQRKREPRKFWSAFNNLCKIIPEQGGVMNSSIAPIGIARRMILAIVTSREIYPGNFEWIQRAKLFRGFKR